MAYPGENENILYMQEMEDRAVNQGLPPIPKEEWRLQRQQPAQPQQPQQVDPQARNSVIQALMRGR